MLKAPVFPNLAEVSGACERFAAAAACIAQSADAFGKVVVPQSPPRTYRDTKPKRNAAAARAKRKAQRAARKKQRR